MDETSKAPMIDSLNGTEAEEDKLEKKINLS